MTTPMNETDTFRAFGGPQLVYVREVSAKDIIAETPDEVVEEFALVPDMTLYALHSAAGERLAVLADRDTAFAAARAHALAPVSVH